MLSYQFKYKLPNGNVKTLDKLVGYLSDNHFIKFDFNIPSELKGKGIGSIVLDDIIKYYNVKHPNYKGFLGEWHGKNLNYIDGASDNFKSFKEAIKSGKTQEQAAFETWTGKQMKKHGFTKIKVITNDNNLVLIEFTK